MKLDLFRKWFIRLINYKVIYYKLQSYILVYLFSGDTFFDIPIYIILNAYL